jgi:hypothetical protein
MHFGAKPVCSGHPSEGAFARIDRESPKLWQQLFLVFLGAGALHFLSGLMHKVYLFET